MTHFVIEELLRMSMFSTHYLITNADKSKYWTGVEVNNSLFWGDYLNAVKFHSRSSAEQVISGILRSVICGIVEDE